MFTLYNHLHACRGRRRREPSASTPSFDTIGLPALPCVRFLRFGCPPGMPLTAWSANPSNKLRTQFRTQVRPNYDQQFRTQLRASKAKAVVLEQVDMSSWSSWIRRDVVRGAGQVEMPSWQDRSRCRPGAAGQVEMSSRSSRTGRNDVPMQQDKSKCRPGAAGQVEMSSGSSRTGPESRQIRRKLDRSPTGIPKPDCKFILRYIYVPFTYNLLLSYILYICCYLL